jgi:putative transposase
MPEVTRHHRYPFPPAIISHAVWLYYRFSLSFRDVEDLLAQRGITVSYESIRQWCETFGLAYARRLRHRAGPIGHTWHLDELLVTIRDQRQYLWRAVDQDGDVLDILLQPHRDRHAAARFFRKLLKRSGRVPHCLVTDRLGSYRAAHRVVMPSVRHDPEQSTLGCQSIAEAYALAGEVSMSLARVLALKDYRL